ncbi:UDP-N-acetylmuramoyl-tripeptide--D-alanyl-D-alanine ligase [Nocardioides nanhaiensis]|uniref:UDP-N-acetylmuramoyl-tripeptide--D-alanyl-D-alanine ligase n=1 Tax=Nocardioides nanhaiensis TaxID=1476871 RepID=A0ABP8WS46_9ACTN
MIPLRLEELAAVVGGQVHTGSGDAGLVVDAEAYLDSRNPVPGGLFVAVVGERVDGHDYADGAHAVLGSRPTQAPTVVVTDPVVALGRLARHVVDRLPATVLAMTGSQGKTGTKDFLAHVLAEDDARDNEGQGVVATAGNLNNELGVPLTVLRATPATRHLVVEMGARGIGHIGYLCELAAPSIAAVLNVGTAHIGEFGSREAIAAAKGEIVEALPAEGTAVLNADDDLVAAMAPRTAARVATFGERGDVTWRELELDDLGRASFLLGEAGAGERWHPVRLRASGAHQVANAAAAATLARAAGLGLEQVAHALSGAEPASRWRMELHERADGLLVVNDAYNANPASMRSALATLGEIGRRRGRRTVAVLGVMRELGGDHDAGHHEVGEVVAASGVDVLVVVGEEARGIAEGARAAGGWAGEAILTASRDDATAWVRENALGSDVVLVKASRGAELDRLADALITTPHDPPTDLPEGDAPTP